MKLGQKEHFMDFSKVILKYCANRILKKDRNDLNKSGVKQEREKKKNERLNKIFIDMVKICH